jgi:hypothetical protein
MTTFLQTTSEDAAELFALEHHFPVLQTIFGLSFAAAVASTVLMLMAQA